MLSRRGFMQVLGLAPLAAGARPGRASGFYRKATLIQQSSVAGFQYHEGERLWHRLRKGQRLDLVREPDNPFDARAVRVDWKGRKLGYIPRDENHAVAQMLDRGQRVDARIHRLREAANPWERIQLEVSLLS